MKFPANLFTLSGILVLVAIPTSVRLDAQEKPIVPTAKDKEKFIDYEALLNDKLGKGITPEKNAVVLLWKALGPTPCGGKSMPPAFFKRLGIEEPTKNGDYFIDLNSYMKDHLKLAPEEFNGISGQQGRASKHPWEEKNYPQIGGWLKANEKPLALIIEACKRPDYYSPIVAHTENGQPGLILSARLPVAPKCREVAEALTARAMLFAFQGKNDAAWRDLVACHLLGRLIARGGTAIELITGIAIDRTASNADLALLETAGPPSRTILQRLKDLQALPPMSSMADTIDITERLTFLQILQMCDRDAAKLFQELPGQLNKRFTDEQLKALATLDWEPAIADTNERYDRIVAAMRIKDRSLREKEFDKVEQDLAKAIKEATDEDKLSKLLLSKDGPGKTFSKPLSTILFSTLRVSFRKLSDDQDRAIQRERNLHLAFALAAYKQDQGRYPATLADLSPKYLPTIPDDLFSGKALIYKPTEKGYLLYSVGENGKDEDGRGKDDEPPGDDLSVRMPLPPLKK